MATSSARRPRPASPPGRPGRGRTESGRVSRRRRAVGFGGRSTYPSWLATSSTRRTEGQDPESGRKNRSSPVASSHPCRSASARYAASYAEHPHRTAVLRTSSSIPGPGRRTRGCRWATVGLTLRRRDRLQEGLLRRPGSGPCITRPPRWGGTSDRLGLPRQPGGSAAADHTARSTSRPSASLRTYDTWGCRGADGSRVFSSGTCSRGPRGTAQNHYPPY
jgi:hypothetical protein